MNAALFNQLVFGSVDSPPYGSKALWILMMQYHDIDKVTWWDYDAYCPLWHKQ